LQFLLCVGALLCAVQWLGHDGWQRLRYERSALVAGDEAWRLVSGHLIHYDWVHLGWNIAGLALVAALFGRQLGWRAWLLVLVASTIAIDLGFLLLQPELEWYVGFSGVLHGMLAAALVWSLALRPDAITLLVAVVLAAKLLYEHLVGPLPFTAQTLGVSVVHAAHTYGAVGGALAGAGLALRARRRIAPSL
jgi:rhomboid family GlyGly-CTERM serine protease